jgi:integrase
VSTNPTRLKHRSDSDPVRVYPDGRIWYWTGGRPGAGSRRCIRAGSSENAQVVAAKLRTKLARTNGAASQSILMTLDESFQTMLAWMRTTGRPAGTISQYKSNWNVWVPPEVGSVRCIDIEPRHWAAIFDHAMKEKASKTTIKAIARTLNAFLTFAEERGHFVNEEPFGQPRARRRIVARATRSAPEPKRRTTPGLRQSPTGQAVETFANAFEKVYPGFGYRLVLLAFGTGLRFNELLALRHDSFNFDTGHVLVTAQLDRRAPWPATKPPKHGRTRTAEMWRPVDHIAQSLVKDSLDRHESDPHHGWLFPRHRSRTAWADRAGRLSAQAVAACEWEWTFHWLRHAYATYCLASPEAGGFGSALRDVSSWLGHSKPSTTMDMYVEKQAGVVSRARAESAQLPK